MLQVLEYYLELIGYLRSYIHFYIQLLEHLYSLKTRFLKSTLNSNQERWAYISKTKLGALILLELAFFHSI